MYDKLYSKQFKASYSCVLKQVNYLAWTMDIEVHSFNDLPQKNIKIHPIPDASCCKLDVITYAVLRQKFLVRLFI